jgi:SHS2 domain-containing protein
MSEGYSTFEHTGDLGLEVWAASPERLYALAAIALHAQIIEVADAAGAVAAARRVERRISIEGQDPADLLVHWLNTTLLEAEVAGVVWTAAEVLLLTPRGLDATLAGPRRDRARQVFLREIKAVSHHALELDLTPESCRCRLILDI